MTRAGLLKGGLAFIAVVALIGARIASPNRQAIWDIVRDKCTPAAEAGAPLPKPCVAVDLAKGEAIIKDHHGVAQLLEIPTHRVTGVEDPQLLTADAPNYFADAWDARRDMKVKPPREGVVLTINSSWARGQDQLHIHIDCIRADVAKTLAAYAPHLDGQWRPMTEALAGRKYWARRVDGADLKSVNPFRLLAEELPEAHGQLGDWSLAAAPVLYEGQPGFALLADPFTLEGGGHAEDLQDLKCKAAK